MVCTSIGFIHSMNHFSVISLGECRHLFRWRRHAMPYALVYWMRMKTTFIALFFFFVREGQIDLVNCPTGWRETQQNVRNIFKRSSFQCSWLQLTFHNVVNLLASQHIVAKAYTVMVYSPNRRGYTKTYTSIQPLHSCLAMWFQSKTFVQSSRSVHCRVL